jgi:AcrR family transcriptional regulator
MSDIPNNKTREEILKVAEKLFMKRGYAGVKLRDIAAEVGMRHASLYYYAPDGKKGLFIEVMKRSFYRHRAGLEQTIADAPSEISAQMHAVAEWMITQPPMDLGRMTESDLPAMEPEIGAKLGNLAIESITLPLIEALDAAAKRGEITPMHDYATAAMAFTVLVESVHNIPDEVVTYRIPGGRKQVSKTLTDMLLNGWLPR